MQSSSNITAYIPTKLISVLLVPNIMLSLKPHHEINYKI